MVGAFLGYAGRRGHVDGGLPGVKGGAVVVVPDEESFSVEDLPSINAGGHQNPRALALLRLPKAALLHCGGQL